MTTSSSFLWTAIPPFFDICISDEQKWNLVRSYRNELLIRCDWTQLPDAPLTLEEKQTWAEYRQTLRNIPEDFATPDEVVFPDAPGAPL